jgi:UDP-glucose 4-epimerase
MDYDKLNGSQCLITGGLGFIGSNLAHQLIELGCVVTIVDSLAPGMGGNPANIADIKEKVDVNIADIRDEEAMSKLVLGKDYVFHLAAQLSHVNSMKDPFNDLDINCRGSLVLLEACRKYNKQVKVVYTGTRAQYGRILYNPVDESHPINATDATGVTKHAAEQYHRLYHEAFGIRTVSLRLTNTYGPRHQMKHSDQGFIGWFLRLAMENTTIKIFGEGKQIRDINYVDDVVDAILRAAIQDRAGGETFNMGGCPIATIDLVQLILGVVGSGNYELVPYPADWKKMEVGDYIANIARAKEALGWEPRTAVEDGLRRMRDYYEQNRAQYW